MLDIIGSKIRLSVYTSFSLLCCFLRLDQGNFLGIWSGLWYKITKTTKWLLVIDNPIGLFHSSANEANYVVYYNVLHVLMLLTVTDSCCWKDDALDSNSSSLGMQSR